MRTTLALVILLQILAAIGLPLLVVVALIKFIFS